MIKIVLLLMQVRRVMASALTSTALWNARLRLGRANAACCVASPGVNLWKRAPILLSPGEHLLLLLFN